MFSYFDFCLNPPLLLLVLDDADDGFFSNTSAYAEKNLLFIIISESSPLPVVVVVLVVVLLVLSPLETPAALLAKVPKRFRPLISFPSSSSHRDDDDFPTPPPPCEEEEREESKGERGDTAKGFRPPFQVRRVNTFIKDILSLLLVLIVFPFARGESLRFWTNASERTHIYSLSLSLFFFRYLSRFERWRETPG